MKYRSFFNAVGVRDVYSAINQIKVRQMDNTFIRGSKLIDTIAISNRIIQCVEGCKSIDKNSIILSNHRAYLVNINLKKYFSE